MKTLLVAFLFCLTSNIANAETFQTTRTIPCDKASEVMSILPKYGEKPVWQGKNTKGLFVLLTMNPGSETWSLIITDGEFACLLESGTGFIVQKDSVHPQKNKPEPEKQIYNNL